jgi:hypothetical protein
MSWFSAEHLHQLISTYGYGAVGAIVAMESIGLPAPGEIILIVCAVYASTHHDLNIWGVIAVAAAGAILGDKTLAIQPLRPDGLPPQLVWPTPQLGNALRLIVLNGHLTLGQDLFWVMTPQDAIPHEAATVREPASMPKPPAGKAGRRCDGGRRTRSQGNHGEQDETDETHGESPLGYRADIRNVNGSAGSSFAGSTTPTISSALSNLPPSSSSSNDFEVGSSQNLRGIGYHYFQETGPAERCGACVSCGRAGC